MAFTPDPVIFKVPLIAADPVCGNPPTPVNPAPLPIKDPLTVPLTNKLPVKAVLPLTLTARAELPVTNNEPETVLDPVICVLPLCSKLPDSDVLPLTLTAKAELPVIINDPETLLDPVTFNVLPSNNKFASAFALVASTDVITLLLAEFATV